MLLDGSATLGQGIAEFFARRLLNFSPVFSTLNPIERVNPLNGREFCSDWRDATIQGLIRDHDPFHMRMLQNIAVILVRNGGI